jgi:hypothetical protein
MMASEADLKMEIVHQPHAARRRQPGCHCGVRWRVLYLFQAHGVLPDYRHFHGIPSPADRIAPLRWSFTTWTVAASSGWAFCC